MASEHINKGYRENRAKTATSKDSSMIESLVRDLFETGGSNNLIHTIHFDQVISPSDAEHIEGIVREIYSVQSVLVDAEKANVYVKSSEPGEPIAQRLTRHGFSVEFVR